MPLFFVKWWPGIMDWSPCSILKATSTISSFKILSLCASYSKTTQSWYTTLCEEIALLCVFIFFLYYYIIRADKAWKQMQQQSRFMLAVNHARVRGGHDISKAQLAQPWLSKRRPLLRGQGSRSACLWTLLPECAHNPWVDGVSRSHL